jgi:uncharacterized protein (TIGR02271 family)
MRQTVVGVFNRYASAQRAVQVLQDSGFGPDEVHITEGSDETNRYADSGAVDSDERRGAEGITDKIRNFFSDLFGPDDDFTVSQYSDAVRRGCAVVKVDVAEEERIDAVREALERAGAVDIEEQAQGRLETGSMQDADLRADTATRSDSGEQVVPVVREELRVGKQAVRRGGVRVYTHTEERPVEETVTLREERAHVERRPVDREVSAADLDPARERTIEVTETTEKPMVEKVARVVEEVVVGKDVQERTEQVRDTVRETQVEVEPLSGESGFRADDYRADFDSRYAASGGRWEEYEPAYRYGHTLRGDQRYAGRSWDEIEPEARRDWESSHPGSAWERFKDSVRHAWERVKR